MKVYLLFKVSQETWRYQKTSKLYQALLIIINSKSKVLE